MADQVNLEEDELFGGGRPIHIYEAEELAIDHGNAIVNGVALGEDDVTFGSSKTAKKWSGEALAEKAHTLEGSPIVRDHVNDKVDAIVGTIDKAKYKSGVGVLYEATISDEEMAGRIRRGEVEVSPRVRHKPTEELERDDNGNVIIGSGDIKKFDNLSIVTHGASPSNAIEAGPSSAIASASELALAFDHDPSVATDSDVETSEMGEVDDDFGEGADEEAEDTPGTDEEVSELASYHTPSYSDTSDSGEWSKPAKEDFDTDDLSEIASHFIASETEFPPENYGELGFPVVSTDGTLVKGALDSAWKMAGQSDSFDKDKIQSKVSSLADDEFPDSDIGGGSSDDESEETMEPVDVPDGAIEELSEIEAKPPEHARKQAEKVLNWTEDHEETANTVQNWELVRSIADGEELSMRQLAEVGKVGQMKADSGVSDRHRGKPWKDPGHVEYLAYGGDTGINWAMRTIDRMRSSGGNELVAQPAESKISLVSSVEELGEPDSTPDTDDESESGGITFTSEL